MIEELMIDKSSPAESAKRLKRLRHMAGLTRKEFCDVGGFSTHTFAGWETGKFGGLSTKGAEKVINALRKLGIFCSPDWLLHEIGRGPTLNTDQGKALEEKELGQTENIDYSSEQERINTELLTFRNHYKNTADLIIEDNAMSPHFQKGDYVAGTKLFKKEISEAIGLNCIIQLENGLILIRQVHSGEDRKYNLISLNTAISEPFMASQEVISAAPIIWHRRPALCL